MVYWYHLWWHFQEIKYKKKQKKLLQETLKNKCQVKWLYKIMKYIQIHVKKIVCVLKKVNKEIKVVKFKINY